MLPQLLRFFFVPATTSPCASSAASENTNHKEAESASPLRHPMQLSISLRECEQQITGLTTSLAKLNNKINIYESELLGGNSEIVEKRHEEQLERLRTRYQRMVENFEASIAHEQRLLDAVRSRRVNGRAELKQLRAERLKVELQLKMLKLAEKMICSGHRELDVGEVEGELNNSAAGGK